MLNMSKNEQLRYYTEPGYEEKSRFAQSAEREMRCELPASGGGSRF